MESSLDQSYSLTHRKLNGLNGAVSNGPNQQVVVGLADANGPNGQLSRENFTEQAQSENHLFFASVSPTPTKDTNFIKSQGRGPKKTKIKQLAKGKENRTGVHPKAGMAAIIPRDVDMEIDRAETISVCWGIWRDRNERRTGGLGKPGRVILKSALNLVEEYCATNE
ncbi:hypothetical protein CFP56_033416, partial [Quercus suber]